MAELCFLTLRYQATQNLPEDRINKSQSLSENILLKTENSGLYPDCLNISRLMSVVLMLMGLCNNCLMIIFQADVGEFCITGSDR